MSVATHPSPETLAAFVRGDLPPAELACVAEHIGSCAACCGQLARVPDDTLSGLAREAVAAGALKSQNPDTFAALGNAAAEAGNRPAPGGTTPAAATAATVQNTNPKTKPDEDDIPEPLADHPRYKVVRELGAGGMGVVYKAEHRIMGRPVALKVMAAHLTAKAGAVERFRKEVRAAAQLNHPNIVTAHDADEAGGLHFLVMEFVEGISLDRFVAKKGPATIQLAASFTRQAALGLQHAHEKGMVHRDIKPQNMMVNRKAQVKVMDFGLARFVHTDEEEAATRPGGRLPFGSAKPVADPLTNPNLIMGTPDYLSPEQARNSHNVDSRSDIYSLGCTLFFLLTGRPPFSDASSLIDKLLAHTEQAPPPIRELRPDVPEGFAAILDRMLAKKPDDRFETAGDVAVAIQSFIRGTGDAEPKVSEVLEVAAPASGVGLRSPGALTPSPIPMEFDTEPAAREQTLGDTEKPRKTKKSKKAKAKPWWQHPAAKIGAVATLLMVVALAIAVGGKKKDTQPTSSSDDTANNRPALPVNPKGSGPVSHDTKGPNQGDWKGPKDGDPKWPGKGPNLPDLKGPNFPEPKGGPNYPDPKGPDHFEPKGPFVPKGGQLPPVAPWMRPGKPPLPVLYVVPSRELFGGDYFPVAGRLHEQGVKVVTACGQGIEAELIRGMPGDLKAVPVDLRVEQAKAEDYSAIIFCGFNVDEYVMPRGNDYSIAKATRDLLEKFRKENKPLGSICVGERVLLVHGVLKGKSAVRARYFAEKFPGMAVDANVKWKDKERVLTDGKVVTADGPQEARQFADAIVKLVLE